MSTDTIVRPCVCCDAHTAVEKGKWTGEAPVAICKDCCLRVLMGMMPLGQVHMIYQLRCRIVGMQAEQELARKDIGRLFQAQKDMESDMLRSTRAR